MIALLVALLCIGQLLLWRRMRRLEHERIGTTKALTRFVNAQLDLDKSNGAVVGSIPGLVEVEVQKALERHEASAPAVPRLFPN